MVAKLYLNKHPITKVRLIPDETFSFSEMVEELRVNGLKNFDIRPDGAA